MTLVELIVLLVVAAIVGFIGQSLGGYKRDSILLAIVLGFIGAFLGTWLVRTFNLPVILQITVAGVDFPLVWAIIGAALLVGLMGVTNSRRGYRWGVTPPSRAVLVVSIVLAVLAVLVWLGVLAATFSAWALLVTAYIVLLLGNLVHGL
ncbi:MAG: GlsB/YeaQ/YmgE family stress response membrane protein [Anaerolineaceae bacterium]|nr:GlsB/YeaQ/YmgE family stress response membrane protein [Anaerolineaceae bacterium]